jgi:class 3 adenylate cyclase
VEEVAVVRLLERPPRLLRRLVDLGALPEDPPDVRLRKAGLVLSSVIMAALACVWVVTYAALGLWVSALIPLAYQAATVLSIAVFARTRRYRLFLRSQLVLPLLLPFALQWSLGGFDNASAVCLWALTAPIGALVFVGPRAAAWWFAAFAVLVAVSAAIDPRLAADAPAVPQGVQIAFFALTVVGVGGTVLAVLAYAVQAREREQERSERLLLNVLPAPIAARLKEREDVIADDLPEATVLFADLVGFTALADRLPAREVVALLDAVFARWDALAAAHGVEKIKTIGDAYMAAAGLPLPRADHAEAVAAMALAMEPELAAGTQAAGVRLGLRIGIDSGPVVAGVIGRARLGYDLWGDTVNTASRMETLAEPGTIGLTERAAALLAPRFAVRERGTVEVKGKGPMRVWVLLGPRD